MLTPAAISPDKVAIYIRWSTDDQGEGTTLQTQLERSKHFLGSQGWRFREDLVYVDEGFSGGSLDRPALTRLRADVKASRVGCVVVYKIDRLSRSVVDIVDLVLREWEGRCFVKSATEDVNTITPAGKMFFYMLVSFAEYERNVIRERTMTGKIRRAEQGLNPGFRPPFGYRRGACTGTLEVVEQEATLVQEIFQLYRTGNGAGQIAHQLNSQGARLRGKRWRELAVRRILHNPAYAGILVYGRSSRTKALNEKPPYAQVEGAFPAVVDRRVWEECQALLSSRSGKQRKTPSKPTYGSYLLSGLALCRCGAPIHGKRVSTGKGDPLCYYLCSARKRYGPDACSAGHLPMAEIDAELERRVRPLLSVQGPEPVLEILEAQIGKRIGQVRADLSENAAALAAAGERMARIGRDYRAGDLPAKLFAQEMEAMERDRGTVWQREAVLRNRLAALERYLHDRAALVHMLHAVDLWTDLTIPERKRLLQLLTHSIKLFRENRSQQAPTLEVEWVSL